MTLFGHPLSPDDLSALMGAVDTDGSGAVDLDEFIAGLGPFLLRLASEASTPDDDTTTLTPDEMEHLTSVFHAIDVDSSNLLDRDEFAVLLRQLDLAQDDDTIDAVFSAAVPQGLDGEMSFDLFVATMTPLVLSKRDSAGSEHPSPGSDFTPEQYTALNDIFTRIDTDGSNSIDMDELQAGLKSTFGADLDFDQIATIIQHIDDDGDGTIDRQEFIAGIGPLFIDKLDHIASSSSTRLEAIKIVAAHIAGLPDPESTLGPLNEAFDAHALLLQDIPDVPPLDSLPTAPDEAQSISAHGLLPSEELSDLFATIGLSLPRPALRAAAKPSFGIIPSYLSLFDVYHVAANHTSLISHLSSSSSSKPVAATTTTTTDETLESFSPAAMDRIFNLESELESTRSKLEKSRADYTRLKATSEHNSSALADAQAEIRSLSSLQDELAKESARADAAVAASNQGSDALATLQAELEEVKTTNAGLTKELQDMKDWKKANLRTMASLQDELATAQQEALDATAALETERQANADLASSDALNKLKASVASLNDQLAQARKETADAQAKASAAEQAAKDLSDELANVSGSSSSNANGPGGDAMSSELDALGESYTDVMAVKLKDAQDENDALKVDIETYKEIAAKAEVAMKEIEGDKARMASEREQMARKEESFEEIVEQLQAQIAAAKKGSSSSSSNQDSDLASMTADELRELNHSLMDKLKTFDANAAELEKAKSKLASTKSSLSDKLQDAQSVIDDLQVQVETIESDRDAAVAKASKAEKALASAQQALEDAQASAPSPHPSPEESPKPDAASSTDGASAAQLESLRQQLDEWQAAHAKVTAKLEKTKTKRNTAVEQAQEALEGQEALKARVAELETQVEAATSSAAAAQDAAAAEKSAAAKAAEASASQVNELEAKVLQLQSELNAAIGDAAVADSAAQAASQIETDLEKARANVELLEKEKSAADAQISALEAQLKNAQDTNSQAQSQLASARQEVEDAIQKAESATTQCQAAEAKAEGLQEALASLRGELSASRESSQANAGLQDELDKASARIEELHTINKKLATEAETLREADAAAKQAALRDADATSREAASREKELQAAQEARDEAQGRVAKLESDVLGLKTQVSDLSTDLGKAHAELDRLTAELGVHSSAQSAAAASATQLQSILDEKDAQIDQLKKDAKRAAKEAAKTQASLEEALESATSAAEEAQASKTKAKDKLAKLKVSVGEAASALVETEDALRESQKQVAALESQLKEAKASIEAAETAARDKVGQELSDEKAARAAAEEALAEVRSDLELAQNRASRNEEKVSAAQEAAREAAEVAAKEAKALELKLVASEQHASSAEDRCASVMSELGTLEAKIESLESQLEAAKKAAKTAVGEAETASKRAASAEAAVKEVTANLETTQASLTETRTSLLQAETALESTKSSAQELEETLGAVSAKLEREKTKRAALKEESRATISNLETELASTKSELLAIKDASSDAIVAAKAAESARDIAAAKAAESELKIQHLMELLETKDAEAEAAAKEGAKESVAAAKALEKAKEAAQDADELVQSLSAKLEKRNTKVAALKEKVTELGDKVMEVETEAEEARASLAAATSAAASSRAEASASLESLKSELASAVEAKAAAEARAEKAEDESSAARDAAQSEKEKRRAAKSAAQEAIADLEDARDAAVQKAETARASAREANDALASKEAEAASLTVSLEDVKEKLDAASKRCEKLEARRSALTVELHAMEEKVSEQEVQAAAAANRAGEALATAESGKREALARVAELESMLESKEAHVVALQDKVTSEKTRRKEAITMAEARIGELEEVAESAAGYRDKLGSEKTKRKAAEADLAAALERSRDKVEEMSTRIEELEAKVLSEKEKRRALREQGGLLQSSVATLESQVSATRVELGASKEARKVAEEKAGQAEKEAERARGEVEAAKEREERAKAEASGAVRDAERRAGKAERALEKAMEALEEMRRARESDDREEVYKNQIQALQAAAQADAETISELEAVKGALLDKVAASKAKRGALKAKFAESLEELSSKAEAYDALQVKAEKLVAKYSQEKEKRVALLGELQAKQAELEEFHQRSVAAVEKEKKKRTTMMIRFSKQLEDSQSEIASLRTAVMAAEVPEVSDAKLAEFNDKLLNLETQNASLKEAVKSSKAEAKEAKEALKGAAEETPGLRRLIAQKDAEIGALRSELEVAMASVASDDLVKNVTVLAKRELPPAQRKAFIRAKEIELSEEEAAIERLQAKLKAAGEDFVRMKAATREAEELLSHAYTIFDSLLEVVVEAEKESQLIELRDSLDRREREMKVAIEALGEDATDETAIHALSVALATLQDTLQIAQASGTSYAVNRRLRETVAKVPIFNGVSDVGFFNDLVRKMSEVVFEPGQFIIRQGELGDSMYFVTKGRVGVYIGSGERVAGMEEGAFFGEIAVLIKGQRTASIKAETYVEVYELSKEALLMALDHFPEQKRTLVRVGEDRLINDMKKKRKAALAVKLADHALDDYARRLAVVGDLMKDSVGARRRNDVQQMGDELMALLSSAASEIPEEFAWLREGVGASRGALRSLLDDVFGDRPPKFARPDLDDVLPVAVEGIRAGREMVFVAEMRECLDRVPFLCDTDDAFKLSLLKHAVVEDYADNDHIIDAGTRGDKLFFLVDGNVEVILPNGTRVGNLVAGEYFGENGFVTDVERTANVWCITPCTVAWLSRAGLEEVLGGHPNGEELRAQVMKQHSDEEKKFEFERLSLRKRFKESLNVIAQDDLKVLVEELPRLEGVVVADLEGVGREGLVGVPEVLARVGDMVRIYLASTS